MFGIGTLELLILFIGVPFVFLFFCILWRLGNKK